MYFFPTEHSRNNFHLSTTVSGYIYFCWTTPSGRKQAVVPAEKPFMGKRTVEIDGCVKCHFNDSVYIS